MKLRHLFISILSFSLLVLFIPAHADRWKDMKDKLEHSVKSSIKDAQSDDDTSGPAPSGKWVGYNGDIPPNAVAGGFIHGHPVFICQSSYNGGEHPGRITEDACTITYGGQEVRLPIDAILVGHHYYWQNVDPNDMPPNAVVGGGENGGPLFICQAPFEGGVYPGKVVAGACNIGSHGAEIMRGEFKVLCRGDAPEQAYDDPDESYAANDDDSDD